MIGLHASCAARDGEAVLLLGESGSGKSDLLLRLIDRGWNLVADDRVEIEAGEVAAPAALAGLIELRGLGLLRLPYVARARLRLAVALDAATLRRVALACEGDAAGGGEAGALPGSLTGSLTGSLPGAPPGGSDRLPVPMRHRLLGVPLVQVASRSASAAFHVDIALDCVLRRRVMTVGALAECSGAGR